MTEEKKKINEKPLDKMTVTELREIAKEIPEIVGAHGMKKADLLGAIKENQGIKDEPEKKSVDEPKKKTAAKPKAKKVITVKELKGMIKALRTQRSQALTEKNKKLAKIYRRRISRLKKKTRQAA